MRGLVSCWVDMTQFGEMAPDFEIGNVDCKLGFPVWFVVRKSRETFTANFIQSVSGHKPLSVKIFCFPLAPVCSNQVFPAMEYLPDAKTPHRWILLFCCNSFHPLPDPDVTTGVLGIWIFNHSVARSKRRFATAAVRVGSTRFP